MIGLNDFLSAIARNASRIKDYLSGHDGSDGTCDCIGLIIGALRLCGVKWTGTHGSNWTARNGMRTLDYISSASSLFPGEIVYKAREPGQSGYSLPAAYKNSSDQRDYYHVGVVTSVSPLCITHCSTGGMHYDDKLGAWHWGGELKYADYSKWEEKPMEALYTAAVYADTGKTVRMRQTPSANGKIVTNVPVFQTVDVLEDANNEWSKISWDGKTGYMMRKFLNTEDGPLPSDESKMDVVIDLLSRAIDMLKEMK